MAIKDKAKRFNNKLKESLNTALIAAFGFLIALVWRDLITEYVNQLTQYSPLQGKLFSAITITFIGVIGILIVTSLLSKKE
jgi:hypothetical protein